MPTLRLKNLLCQVTEDNGADEPYLVVNGQTIWGPTSINAGGTKSVNRQFYFVNSAEIKLFEEDAIDANDYLGMVTATSAMKGQGEKQGKFTGDGANYTLYYDVI
jgi:hypothetical protein